MSAAALSNLGGMSVFVSRGKWRGNGGFDLEGPTVTNFRQLESSSFAPLEGGLKGTKAIEHLVFIVAQDLGQFLDGHGLARTEQGCFNQGFQR